MLTTTSCSLFIHCLLFIRGHEAIHKLNLAQRFSMFITAVPWHLTAIVMPKCFNYIVAVCVQPALHGVWAWSNINSGLCLYYQKYSLSCTNWDQWFLVARIKLKNYLFIGRWRSSVIRPSCATPVHVADTDKTISFVLNFCRHYTHSYLHWSLLSY